MNGPGPISSTSPDIFTGAPYTFDVNGTAVNDLATGSGYTAAGTPTVARLVGTGTTPGSRAGVAWAKSVAFCPPGLGAYHNVYWPAPLRMSFQFAFNGTLPAGVNIIGSTGVGADAFPTALPWDMGYPSLSWIVSGSGALSVYVVNFTTGVRTLHVTGATLNTTFSGQSINQEIFFRTDGLGNVRVYLNRRLVATYSGVEVNQIGTDNYPFLVMLNEPTGTPVDTQLLIFQPRVLVDSAPAA